MNKVVVFGNDHINTLGVIRLFGENGIKPYLFLISDKKRNSTSKSKYVNESFVFETEEQAVDFMMEYFNLEKEKVAIIPTSDKTSLCLDKNYSKLKAHFFVPNINEEDNNIYKYMDKFVQQQLFSKTNINGIKSMIMELNDPAINIDIDFPIILKPNVSANGSKDDITICENEAEFKHASEKLLKLGYNSILVQKFIKYDFEADIQGFSYNGETSIPGVIEKIRIWPAKRGSTTYGRVIPCDAYNRIISCIKKIMKEIKYTGIFDIDIFVVNKEDGTKEFYLNEINFRNSAISYAYRNSYICYYWYLSCVKDKLINSPLIEAKYNFMDDHADIHNILDKNISLKQYLFDKKNSKILLVQNKNDKKPHYSMFINKVIGNLVRKK